VRKRPTLNEISISGIGVIEKSNLEFGPGLTVITGETGAGKTMVLTALNLVLGGKADSALVRHGQERAIANATFQIPTDFASRFDEKGIISEEGELKATWVFTVNNDTVTKTETHKVVTPYVDLGYLYEMEYSEDEQMNAERYARYAIERYTGQKFGKRSGWQKVQGNGTDILILPERIISITSLYENGTLVWELNGTNNIISNVETVNSHFGIRCTDHEDVIEHYAATALNAGGSFVDGYTYEVIGSYGYDNVPDDILFCGRMLVDDFFCQDRTWREKWATQIKSGDWSVALDTRVFSGTGNSYVDAILDDYAWHRMVII